MEIGRLYTGGAVLRDGGAALFFAKGTKMYPCRTPIVTRA